MSTEKHLDGNPDSPTIVGFDMPSAAPSDGVRADQVLVALLDVKPSIDWRESFVERTGEFTMQHALTELRLTGKNITAIAQADRLRRLTDVLRAFVHRVSRATLRERVAGRSASARQTLKRSAPAPVTDPEENVQVLSDVARVSAVAGVAAILEAVTRATGMRFAAVARVSDTRWTACAVYDNLEFGLLPGQDLALESTICNEIRQHGSTVAFDCASDHAEFATHHTPSMYGFESYISVPIRRADGSFFGTLCALDPEPSLLDRATIETLEMFARTIGLELDRPHETLSDGTTASAS